MAFACYFSSFEVLSQGRKDDNLSLFLGEQFYISLPVCPSLTSLTSLTSSWRTGRDLFLGDDLPPGCHQVQAAGGRLGSPPEISHRQAVPPSDSGRGGHWGSLQRVWINNLQGFHRQWSHPHGL